MPRWLKVVFMIAIAILMIALVSGLVLRRALRGSLPALHGEAELTGLSAPVTVERDALGVPTIRGASRADVARGLGFVHAQERFFQMDLLRRQGAGELAELFGPAALDADRAARVHRFRALATLVLRDLPERQREVLRAYVDGVNAGLAALDEVPFEYLLLRLEPERWTEEDSILVLDAMYFELNDETGHRESARGLVDELLDPELAAFLLPTGTGWDAPLDGVVFDPPPIPGTPGLDADSTTVVDPEPEAVAAAAGSANWAVAGSRTADGRAILANDMHLGLRVPNTWYRAGLEWPGAKGGPAHRVVGVTLPGSPAVVAGSNTRVAWGFTNSYGDWSDLVILELDGDRYLSPDGARDFERWSETVQVRGGDPVTIELLWTIWGPVVDQDHLGRPRALRWIAHDPSGADLGLLDVERASSVVEAMAAANRTAIPPQNFVCADDAGHIGWTIIGRIPVRRGFSGRVPTSWADGTRGWDGWLDPAAYPRIVDPPDGVLWTANNRQVSGDWLELLGDGGLDLGARARQIRDDLLSLDDPTEVGMLAVQLDDRALFLERWRRLALEVLSDDAVAGHPRRAAFRRLVESTWTGRASVDSQGYRLVRAFRIETLELVYAPFFAACVEADVRFNLYDFVQWEDSLWRLVTERPEHMLRAGHDSWQAALLAAVDAATEYFENEVGADPDSWTWGNRNTVRIRHPMSLAVPQLGRWLDMPSRELPGDSLMPRVQSPSFGASERFAVSPGREDEGYFHMPCGQSGHPLSPHYRAGHEAWAEGWPTPFLPGETQTTLTLIPAAG